MSRLSLRFRLIIAGGAAVVVALALAALGLSMLFSAHVQRNAVAALSVEMDEVLAGIGHGPSGDTTLVEAPTDPRSSRPFGGLYWQIEMSGHMLRSRSLWDYVLPLPKDRRTSGAPVVLDLHGPTGRPVLVIMRDVVLPVSLGREKARVAS